MPTGPEYDTGNRLPAAETQPDDLTWTSSGADDRERAVRIAQVAPLYESVPPQLYGGTERVVSYLTEELVRLGHEVTLFASGDSRTKANLVAACPKALWRDGDCHETTPHHVRLMELVFQDVSRFDVI